MRRRRCMQGCEKSPMLLAAPIVNKLLRRLVYLLFHTHRLPLISSAQGLSWLSMFSTSVSPFSYLSIKKAMVVPSAHEFHWQSLARLPSGRVYHSLTEVGGQMYMLGGCDAAGRPCPALELYSPEVRYFWILHRQFTKKHKTLQSSCYNLFQLQVGQQKKKFLIMTE